MFRTSVLFELGDEGKLGLHDVVHAQVTLESVQGAEGEAMALIRLGLQQLVENPGFFLSRSIGSHGCSSL